MALLAQLALCLQACSHYKITVLERQKFTSTSEKYQNEKPIKQRRISSVREDAQRSAGFKH